MKRLLFTGAFAVFFLYCLQSEEEEVLDGVPYDIMVQ